MLTCFAVVVVCAAGGAMGQTDFTVISALGDSLTDTPPERGPNHAQQIAEKLGVELNNFALIGATSTSLLETGQHTDAVDAGTTFAFLWIGANDLLFVNLELNALGFYFFVPGVIENWEAAADALQAGGATVITANLPDLSRLAGSAESADAIAAVSEFDSQTILANVRGGTIAFNEALAASAAQRGIPVVDVFSLFTDLMDEEGTVCGQAVGLPPNRGAATDLFFDEIHPSSFGMGLVTNAFIAVMNDEFDADLTFLTEEHLGTLAGLDVCDVDPPPVDDDADDDGVIDDEDLCPGEDDLLDTDDDGTSDCLEDCPDDPAKLTPGMCGCGVADTDTDSDGTPDCDDGCPGDADKIEAGACGCGQADTDTDSDGTPDCNDGCPDDVDKVDAGVCGCGESDADTDADGVPDCIDNCPDDVNTIQTDSNGDGIGDACDSAGGGNGGGGNSGGSTGGGFCAVGITSLLPLMLLGVVGLKRRLRRHQ